MSGSVKRAKIAMEQIMDRLDEFQGRHNDPAVLELSAIVRELAFTLQHLLESAREIQR
jgi:hypothetical protein